MNNADRQRLFWQQQIERWQPGQHLTVQSFERLIEDVGIVPVKPAEWLLAACRGALFVATCTDRELIGKAEVRDELQVLSRDAWALWQRLFAHPNHFEGALLEQAWLGMTPSEAANMSDFESPPQFERFLEAVNSVQWLGAFFYQTAARLDEERQRPNWRRSIEFDRRVEAAVCLIPVFAAGFGRSATVNIEPKKPGSAAWAKFYVAVTELIDIRSADNLRKVLLEAKRQHRQNGVSFAPGVMPD